MHYLKANIVQLFFMLMAVCLLAYGYIKEDPLVMVFSSILPILVWFIDAYRNDKKEMKTETELIEAKTKIKDLQGQVDKKVEAIESNDKTDYLECDI